MLANDRFFRVKLASWGCIVGLETRFGRHRFAASSDNGSQQPWRSVHPWKENSKDILKNAQTNNRTKSHHICRSGMARDTYNKFDKQVTSLTSLYIHFENFMSSHVQTLTWSRGLDSAWHFWISWTIRYTIFPFFWTMFDIFGIFLQFSKLLLAVRMLRMFTFVQGINIVAG